MARSASGPRVGVLALQGDFREHAALLRELGASVTEVRQPDDLVGLAGLVLPGGESTAITRLAASSGLDQAIQAFPGALLGTCAGMILLDRGHWGRLDVVVERNAYGRQLQSFEAEVALAGEPDELPLKGVFIRAPRVADWGPEVEVLASLGADPVVVRQGPVLAASFHPELLGEPRLHRLFLDAVEAAALEAQPHIPAAPAVYP